MVTNQLFTAEQGKAFGQRYNGRYHLPLLPGEQGTKGGGDWVPWGVQSATNLAGSIVESRALGIWERERSQIGLALDDALRERMAFAVRSTHHRLLGQGVDLCAPGVRLVDHAPELKAELDLIHAQAKDVAGGSMAARQGTNRHDVWEERGRSGNLFGTPDINEQVEQLERLLAANHLRRVPGLQERVVRNVKLRAAGRFDDVLQDIRTGRLYLADLKTKRRAYYTWLEVRIQIAVYATAEWMLSVPFDATEQPAYVTGPRAYVDQDWGIVLWAPASGDEPALKRVNLRKGLEHALLARAVCDARSEAKSVAAHGEAAWQ